MLISYLLLSVSLVWFILDCVLSCCVKYVSLQILYSSGNISK